MSGIKTLTVRLKRFKRKNMKWIKISMAQIETLFIIQRVPNREIDNYGF